MIIGLTGSVAGGKSSYAKKLAQSWVSCGKTVQVISSDSFLYSNSKLLKLSLFERKGFPESYNNNLFRKFIIDYKFKKKKSWFIPLYSHKKYNIVSYQQIFLSDILIVEGVGLSKVIDLFDVFVFLDVYINKAKQQYIQRTLHLISIAKIDTYYYNYKNLSLLEIINFICSTWNKTNLLNYYDYILPLKNKADYILSIVKKCKH